MIGPSMGHDTSNPRLDGARHVYFRLTDPRHADLDGDIQKVESAWARARKVLVGAGGLCHCGNRWGHLMDGVEVMLLDRAPYTARCWDDDRVWINLPLFAEEPDGGVGALVHEFGHRIWFQCLSPEQQAAWAKSWQEAKKRPSPRWEGQCSGTVSGYACTSDLEDFAEVFQAMVQGTIDDYNWKRWVAVCGCGKGSCEAPVRRVAKPSGESANLRRAPRTPGKAASIGRTPGGSVAERVLADTLLMRKMMPALMERIPGKWIVFRDGEVRSGHRSMEAAFAAAIKKYGVRGAFVISRVEHG
jgi:hypothetical protein